MRRGDRSQHDEIEVTGPATVDVVILTGRFAPGLTPEADGESEIEIEIAISLGWGSNTLRLNLPNGHDRVAMFGSGRFDIADDGDEDIAVVDTLNLQLIIDGGGGNAASMRRAALASTPSEAPETMC